MAELYEALDEVEAENKAKQLTTAKFLKIALHSGIHRVMCLGIDF